METASLETAPRHISLSEQLKSILQ